MDWKARESAKSKADQDAGVLLAEVAKILDGGGWQLVNHQDNGRILVNGDQRIGIRREYNKVRRLTLSGWTPKLPDGMHYSYMVKGPSITVSIDRDAGAVAKDIERRLLPDYHVALAEQAERVANWYAHEGGIEGLTSRLVDILKPDRPPKIGTNRDRDISLYNLHPRVSGSVDVGSKDSARFEFYVSGADNIATVAEVLARVGRGVV